MNPEIKTKWLSALRSGEYSQGERVLRDKDNNYCCLGVLCDIAIKENPELAKWEKSTCDINGNEVYRVIDSLGYEAYVLNPGVLEWSGLTENNPKVNGAEGSLAELNDQGHTFKEIADIIEAQL